MRLTSAVSGQVFDVDLPDAETKSHFLKLIELAVAGRGRLALEIETDGKTIRTFVFDVP